MEIGLAFRRWNVPLLGGRSDQHQARGSAGFPHGAEEVPDRLRAVGILTAVAGIGDGLFDPDPFPIGIQFVRDHPGKRRAGPLPHLRTMSDDDHAAVRLDPKVHAGLPGRPVLPGLRRLDARGARAEHQGPSRERGPQEIAATRQVDPIRANRPVAAYFTGAAKWIVCFHAFTPAASLIACRIRWYVPQRHRLPSMAASISWSVGFGFCFSNAAACMIWPLWQ